MRDYRYDIDGLRAIAVLIVTLFHLELTAFEGGYIGVDVFFVISGYLITSIIWDKSRSDSFRLGSFYLGRVRRLLPPLIATIFFTTLGAAILMMPEDLIRYARSAIAALFSLSNILFYMESGYWDSASDLKPLLHTWSLGVEEQFYLVWPVFVLLAARLKSQRVFLGILLAAAVTSLIASIWYFTHDPSGAFYLFPFRIFQFAFGAVIAFAMREKYLQALIGRAFVGDGLAVTGLLMILLTALTYTAETPFPGMNAVVPTLGSMLVLAAGASGQGVVGRAVLSNPVSVFTGQISYAMYLVHWPIIVLYRYATDPHFTLVEQAGLAVLILIATLALHYGVERRFYRRPVQAKAAEQMPAQGFALRVLGVSLCLALVCGHIVWTGGWQWRLPSLLLTPEAIEAGKSNRFVNGRTTCTLGEMQRPVCNGFGADGRINVLILGNSHETDGLNFFYGGYGDDDRVRFLTFGEINACRDPVRSNGIWMSGNEGCQKRLNLLFSKEFASRIDVLVYSAKVPFGWNKQVFADMITDLRALSPELKVITMGGFLTTDTDCPRLVNEAKNLDACGDPDHVSYFEADPSAEPLYGTFLTLSDTMVDLAGLFCPERQLSACVMSANGEPFSYDRHHLSRSFAEMGGRMWSQQHPDFFQDLLNNKKSKGGGTPLPEPTGSFAQTGDNRFEWREDAAAWTAMPTVSVEAVEGGVRLEKRREINRDIAGGKTGVAHLILEGEHERQLSDKQVRIRLTGFAEAETELGLQYSTNEVGNSGWIFRNLPAGDFVAEFDYSVLRAVNGRGDFIGVIPMDAAVTITHVQIDIIASQ